MSRSRAVLPVSSKPQTVGSHIQFSSFTISPSFRAFLTLLSVSLSRAISKARPWTELLDRTAFSKPNSLSDATSRVIKNFSYFRVNYLILLALALVYSLLSHPFSLLALLSVLAGWFVYVLRPLDKPLVISSRTFSDGQALGGLIVYTAVAILMTNMISLLMSAVLFGLGIVCLHGTLRIPEDLFLDDQEQFVPGFLSMLGGSTSSAAAAAIATDSSVTSRV